MISAVKNYGFPNVEMELSESEIQNLNYQIMRNHACSFRSASILRGEVAITEIRISFLAFVLKKKAVALSLCLVLLSVYSLGYKICVTTL